MIFAPFTLTDELNSKQLTAGGAGGSAANGPSGNASTQALFRGSPSSSIFTSSNEVTPPPLTIAGSGGSSSSGRGQIAAPTGPAPDTNPATQPQGIVSIWGAQAAGPDTSGTSGSSGSSSGTSNGTSTSTSGTTGTPIDTSGGPVGTPNQDALTQGLLDFLAAQYASGAQGGTSPDFGGLITAPVSNATGAPDDTQGDTGAVAAPTSSSSGGGLLLVLVLVGVGVGIWYWRKHHKKKKAAA